MTEGRSWDAGRLLSLEAEEKEAECLIKNKIIYGDGCRLSSALYALLYTLSPALHAPHLRL